MDFDILEKLGKIAGIAGISVGALVLIFSSIIRRKIFPGLTKDQGYKVIRMIVVFAGLLAFVGIGAWVYLGIVNNAREKEYRMVAKHVVGNVVDESGKPVVSVNIEVSQDNSFLDKSDGAGKFALEIKGTGQKYFDLVFKHKSYVTHRKKIKVNFEEEADEIVIEAPVVMANAFPPEQEETEPLSGEVGKVGNVNRGHRDEEPRYVPAGQTVGNRPGKASIILNYMGDYLGCTLNLMVNIGGRTFNPTSNSYRIDDIPAGSQYYTVSGGIACGYESCQATGNGNIFVEDNTNYYVMWDYNTCQVGLYSEEEYYNRNSNYGL